MLDPSPGACLKSALGKCGRSVEIGELLWGNAGGGERREPWTPAVKSALRGKVPGVRLALGKHVLLSHDLTSVSSGPGTQWD